jgi:hypothetical protein
LRGALFGVPDLDHVFALSAAMSLVPASIFWLDRLHQEADGARWVSAVATFPIAIAFSTGALMIVGGAVLLLLLLPALSFLLWPFGIFPTTAAPLLTVSVEQAPTPTPAWRVSHVPESALRSGLGHRSAGRNAVRGVPGR